MRNVVGVRASVGMAVGVRLGYVQVGMEVGMGMGANDSLVLGIEIGLG